MFTFPYGIYSIIYRCVLFVYSSLSIIISNRNGPNNIKSVRVNIDGTQRRPEPYEILRDDLSLRNNVYITYTYYGFKWCNLYSNIYIFVV